MWLRGLHGSCANLGEVLRVHKPHTPASLQVGHVSSIPRDLVKIQMAGPPLQVVSRDLRICIFSQVSVVIDAFGLGTTL